MPVESTPIEGLLVIRWPVHHDERGFFQQRAIVREISERLGRDVHVAQLNHSRTVPGGLRGFHAEPWDKLVYVTNGTILAAVADVRPDSATFGTAFSLLLGDAPGEPVSLFLSTGLANAYANVGDRGADYVYAVSAEWRVTDKLGVRWDDPDLGVDWGLTDPVLSAADRALPTLRERYPDHHRWA